jgi:hypothetical protein
MVLAYLVVILLIALIILALAYYMFLQKIPLTAIAKALRLDMQIINQSGMFSFQTLTLQNRVITAEFERSDFFLSPMDFAFSSVRPMNLRIAVLSIAVQPEFVGFYRSEGDAADFGSPANRLKRRFQSLCALVFFNSIQIHIRQFKFSCIDLAHASFILNSPALFFATITIPKFLYRSEAISCGRRDR